MEHAIPTLPLMTFCWMTHLLTEQTTQEIWECLHTFVIRAFHDWLLPIEDIMLPAMEWISLVMTCASSNWLALTGAPFGPPLSVHAYYLTYNFMYTVILYTESHLCTCVSWNGGLIVGLTGLKHTWSFVLLNSINCQ